MLTNRLCPPSTVIPVLAYPDAPAAADWLCRAFGFTVRVRIGNHRVQLNVPCNGHADGHLILRELRPGEPTDHTLGLGVSVTVRVPDADAHCHHARAHGARILAEPTTHPYGERQYIAEDPQGRTWTFTQTIADVDPRDLGPEFT